MDRPNPDDQTDITDAVSLDETGDVEQENLELSAVVDHVTSQFNRSKDSRLSDEERWLKAYRNYRGLYSEHVQFTSTEKSRAFVKITKTKVLAAYAQISDVLFAGSKFPIGVDARSTPAGVADSVSYDPNGLTPEKVKDATGVEFTMPRNIARPDIAKDLGLYKDVLEPIHDSLTMGTSTNPGAFTYEPAKVAAQKLERKMHDQLDASEGSKHLRSVAFETALFGTGILKGPFAYDKEYPRWDEEGNYDPIKETVPKVEYVSCWDFYPDPDARNASEMEYAIQRHRMSRTQLRGLKKRPLFREDSIELAISYGPDYIKEYWENTLEDDNVTSGSVQRFEVLEYWGMIDQESAEEAGIEIPDDMVDTDQLQVNVWICNNQILRLVLNETNLVPGQDLTVYPGKVFRRQAGAPGQAIFGTKFPNVSQELMMMFDKARQLADEATGIPSFSHGQTGVTGVGRTASGMSMLMGAAAQGIKAVVRNIDDYLLAPLGKSLFAFNMQFNFDKEYAKGDLDVVARGTESLMRNEIRSQRLMQFMQMAANPQMAPFVKYDYILREMASSMDLDEDKIINDPREAAIQASMMAEIQKLMPQPPQGAAPPTDATGAPQEGGAPAAGAAPEPGAQGFTGAGGGDNGGAPPPPPEGQPPAPPQG